MIESESDAYYEYEPGRRFRFARTVVGLFLLAGLVMVIIFALTMFQNASATGGCGGG
jgi:hypothetical protein